MFQRIKTIVLVASVLLLFQGCDSTPTVSDKTVKMDSFSPQNVAENVSTGSDRIYSAAYQDIESMYSDADAVVQGTVKSIEYSDTGGHPWTKMDFLVEESFKGDVGSNTEISIMEPYGYLRLKTYYDLTQKVYLPDAFAKEDVDDGKTVDLRFADAPETKVGDQYLFFLLASKPDMYEGKQVAPVPPSEVDYPSGSYGTVGVLMGKFQKTESGYERFNIYTSLKDGGDVSIQREYTEKEMLDTLNKLK